MPWLVLSGIRALIDGRDCTSHWIEGEQGGRKRKAYRERESKEVRYGTKEAITKSATIVADYS